MAIDPERFASPRPAPCVVFDQLPARAQTPRFFVKQGDGWSPVTWQQYADGIRDIGMFCARHLGPGSTAAVFAANSVQWSQACLGVQAMGGTLVPIYPASTAEQAAYVVEHAAARVLFVAGAELVARVAAMGEALATLKAVVVMDDADVAPLAELGPEVLHWGEAVARGRARHEEAPEAFAAQLEARHDDECPLMLYTSGSTGRPKGVPLTNRNLLSNWADWVQRLAPMLEDDAIDLLWLPMSHIFGLGETTVGNMLGWTSYLTTPQALLEDMPRVRPHAFLSVPAYWDKLAAKATGDTAEARREAFEAATGGRLRFCMSGGAGLDRSVKELFLACGRLIIEGYGLTECSPTLTLNAPDDYRFDSVGKPLPSVELRLAQDGEILARGPNIFAGYHRAPEASEAAFTDDGWLCTGDLGRFTDDGFLQIIGRKKEILVTAGGKNVAPGNIEARLVAEPMVKHAVVYGDGKKYLVAGLWLEDHVDASDDAVGAAVERANAELARFEQVRRWCVMGQPLTVEAGHLTSTLKLRRKHIYEAFEARFEALYD